MNLKMSLHRKILVVSIWIISALISSFVLMWGEPVRSKELTLGVFMFIQIVLIGLLTLDIIKNN
ncbi:hypothetical protein GCM10008904_00370 [Paraclostridium ghonii]|uniref:Uncharacterized protein n=1 Tax=Paraclostridium ghonii TaxID=29358 RepID=A0ABU0MZ34_9FIRM|nr:hypothetical protein [Paeniclostridium ghonii]MDQ0555859.1 hypothetical protein [Paeniclostridium ghonii]